MTLIHYENHRGGVNNLVVATDWATGEFSTSLISKEHAAIALKRKMARLRRQEAQQ